MADLSGTIRGGVHVYPVRVYYEDTDAAGVVYYANYLKLAERARTEMMRLVGMGNAALMKDDGVVIAVRRCEVDYLRPAHLDDRLEVHTSIVELNGASLWVEQTVKRDEHDVARLKVRLACLTRSGRPARIPGPLRTALEPLSMHHKSEGDTMPRGRS